MTDQTSAPAPKKGILRRTVSGTYSALGFKHVAKGIGMQAETVQQAAGRSKSLFQSYRDALFKKRVVRKESFEEAVARLNLTAAHLEARRRELAITSYLFMAVFSGTFYFLVAALLRGSLMNAFTLLTISMTIGAVVFSQRLRIWQIEQRRLGSPQEFIGHLFGHPHQ